MQERVTYTVREAAARLGVHRDYLYGKIRDLEWPHTRFGSRIKLTEDNINAILEMTKVEPAPARVTRNRKAS